MDDITKDKLQRFKFKVEEFDQNISAVAAMVMKVRNGAIVIQNEIDALLDKEIAERLGWTQELPQAMGEALNDVLEAGALELDNSPG